LLEISLGVLDDPTTTLRWITHTYTHTLATMVTVQLGDDASVIRPNHALARIKPTKEEACAVK